MKLLICLILAGLLTLSACKKNEEAAVTPEPTPADIKSTPIVDSTTQEGYATTALSSAGWSEADLTSVNSNNIATVAEQSQGGDIVSTALQGAVPSASIAAKALASTVAQANLKLSLKNITEPSKATSSTTDGAGYTITTIDEQISYGATCTGPTTTTKGSIGLAGAYLSTTREKMDITSTGYIFDSSSDLQDQLAYVIKGCVGSQGTLTYGTGHMKESTQTTSKFNITTANNIITETSGTITIIGTFKETGGYSVQLSTGEKYKLIMDQDVRVNANVTVAGYDSNTNNFASTTGSAKYLLISTIGVGGVTYSCSLDHTFTYAEILNPATNVAQFMICK